MAGMVVTPGGMPFNKFRAFRNTIRQAEEPYRFVDGELIERFLSCSVELQEEIVGKVIADGVTGVTVESVKGLVEELRRMH